jgi:hypothetical protein
VPRQASLLGASSHPLRLPDPVRWQVPHARLPLPVPTPPLGVAAREKLETCQEEADGDHVDRGATPTNPNTIPRVPSRMCPNLACAFLSPMDILRQQVRSQRSIPFPGPPEPDRASPPAPAPPSSWPTIRRVLRETFESPGKLVGPPPSPVVATAFVSARQGYDNARAALHSPSQPRRRDDGAVGGMAREAHEDAEA